VIKQFGGLRIAGPEVKIILHHQHDINIIRGRLRRNVAAKQDHPLQPACGMRNAIDALQTCGDSLTLARAATEFFDNFLDRRSMDAFWELPKVIKVR
jgi:hypothetical protein